MVKLIYRKTTKSGESDPFLMIDHSVGRNSRNRRGDVFAIQLMLNEVGRLDGHLMKRGVYDRAEPANLAVDGWCGKNTIAEILAYQKAINRKYKCDILHTDSRVNSTKQSTWRSAQFTVLYKLNSDFFLILDLRGITLKYAIKRLLYTIKSYY